MTGWVKAADKDERSGLMEGAMTGETSEEGARGSASPACDEPVVLLPALLMLLWFPLWWLDALHVLLVLDEGDLPIGAARLSGHLRGIQCATIRSVQGALENHSPNKGQPCYACRLAHGCEELDECALDWIWKILKRHSPTLV
jgi:hypothetical protein